MSHNFSNQKFVKQSLANHLRPCPDHDFRDINFDENSKVSTILGNNVAEVNKIFSSVPIYSIKISKMYKFAIAILLCLNVQNAVRSIFFMIQFQFFFFFEAAKICCMRFKFEFLKLHLSF